MKKILLLVLFVLLSLSCSLIGETGTDDESDAPESERTQERTPTEEIEPTEERAPTEEILAENIVIAEVGGEEIYSDDFISRAEYERYLLFSLFHQYYEFVLLYIEYPDLQTSYLNQMATIEFQMEPYTLGQETINKLIEESIIRQEAEKLGIVVSEAEIDTGLQEAFGYTQNATQEPETADMTPTPYTLEMYQENLDNYLSSLNEYLTFTEGDLRELIEKDILRTRVFDAITKDLPNTEEQVWARHIMVDDLDTANEVLDLLAAGEDFVELAAQYSLDTSNKDSGGDLGWFGRSMMVEEFEAAAFSLGIDEISEPVETDFGFHIIEVLGHEDRILNDSDYEYTKVEYFEEWLDSQWNTVGPINHDDWLEYVPASPALPENWRDEFSDLLP